MNDDQLTALAREYAEEMIKGKPSEELPNCLKNSMLAMNTEYVTEIFQWLTRRFCLVEKEKLKAIRFRKVYSAEDVRSKFTEECLIDALFPEIGKEVEDGLV